MFRFHKIGNDVAQGWYCLITLDEEMKAHAEHMGRRVWRNWKLIKDSPKNREGHCVTSEAGAYKTLLTMEMARRGIEKISFSDAIIYLTDLAMQSTLEVFAREGEVYVSRNGACRPNINILEHEEILEKVVRKDYIYPVHTKNEYSIVKWPGGNHFYVMENGNSIPIDGQIKWKTCEVAQQKLDWHWCRVQRERRHYGGAKCTVT